MRRGAEAAESSGDAAFGRRILAAAEDVGARLRRCGWRLVTAESCTAGGIAYAVTQVAGSSAWFDRGWVTYSNAAKEAELGVDPALIRSHGAVSEAVVEAMACGALAASGAEVAVAVSGVAGPGGGSRSKPVGTVCFAWAIRGAGVTRETRTTLHFAGDRAQVRSRSILAALDRLAQELDAAAGLRSAPGQPVPRDPAA